MIAFRKATESDTVWFTAQTEYRPGPGFLGIVALLDDGHRAGMIGLDFWTPKSVQMHIALEKMDVLPALWREVIRFLKSEGRELVYAVTPSDRTASLRLQHAAGFKETYRMTDAWDHGVDMVLSEKRI